MAIRSKACGRQPGYDQGPFGIVLRTVRHASMDSYGVESMSYMKCRYRWPEVKRSTNDPLSLSPQTRCMRAQHKSTNLRKGRVSLRYQAYLVTIATRHREPFFENHNPARLVARSIQELQKLGACHNWCYVIMPDHIHWMFSLGGTSSLSQTVRMLKGKTSRISGISLWQKGFHDHALRHEPDLLPTARYVIANPLRAGLVGRVGDYPYWDAAWL